MSNRRRGYRIDPKPKMRTEKVEQALMDACSELGFCIPAFDRQRISEMERFDAEGFALEVLMAEGLDEISGSDYRNALVALFQKFVG